MLIKTTKPLSGIVNVSTPYYGEGKEIEVNFDALNRPESVKSGHTYPDLITQATYAVNGMEKNKSNMLNKVCEMLSITGVDVSEALIDAMVDCVGSQSEYVDQSMPEHTEWFAGLHYRMRMLAEIAKAISSINRGREALKANMETIECAQSGVLL
jgi:hypothetical protein